MRLTRMRGTIGRLACSIMATMMIGGLALASGCGLQSVKPQHAGAGTNLAAHGEDTNGSSNAGSLAGGGGSAGPPGTGTSGGNGSESGNSQDNGSDTGSNANAGTGPKNSGSGSSSQDGGTDAAGKPPDGQTQTPQGTSGGAKPPQTGSKPDTKPSGSDSGTKGATKPNDADSKPPAAPVKLDKPTEPAMPYKGKPGAKLVALTFDDGPDNRYTPAILDVLKAKGVHATFFCVGLQVKRYGGVMKRIVKEGSEIGNHTYSHQDLSKLDSNPILNQIKWTDTLIRRQTGFVPRLVRAPYGASSPQLKKIVADNGRSLVFWTVDTRDWDGSTITAMRANVNKNTHPGGIILMHSFGSKHVGNTVQLLPLIIKDLQAKGYTFVTVSELLDAKAKAHAKTNVNSKANSGTNTKADAGAKTDANAIAGGNAKAEVEDGTGGKTEAGAKTDTKADAKADTKANTNTNAKAGTNVKTDANAEANTNANTNANNNSDTNATTKNAKAEDKSALPAKK